MIQWKQNMKLNCHELLSEIKCCASRKSKTCRNSNFPSQMQALLIPQSMQSHSSTHCSADALGHHENCDFISPPTLWGKRAQAPFQKSQAEVGREVWDALNNSPIVMPIHCVLPGICAGCTQTPNHKIKAHRQTSYHPHVSMCQSRLPSYMKGCSS